MEEFLRSYGLWILLGAVFVGMHWFGRGCGTSHRSRPETKTPETDDETPAQAGRRSGGCH
jgi:hypothetical protein